MARSNQVSCLPTAASGTALETNTGDGAAAVAAADLRRDIMHPMFKELFLDTDAEELAAEQDRQRRVRRSRRARSAMIVRPAARNRENRPRP
jgi:hypothetical protein